MKKNTQQVRDIFYVIAIFTVVFGALFLWQKQSARQEQSQLEKEQILTIHQMKD